MRLLLGLVGALGLQQVCTALAPSNPNLDTAAHQHLRRHRQLLKKKQQLSHSHTLGARAQHDHGGHGEAKQIDTTFSFSNSNATSLSSGRSMHIRSTDGFLPPNFNKKGIAYGDNPGAAAYVKPFSGNVGWATNWNSDSKGLDSDIPYIPMLWSNTGGRLDNWQAAAEKAIGSSVKVLFSFNEPELPSQANMDTQTAANVWFESMTSFAKQAILVAPAVDSDPAKGKPWLSDFLDKIKTKGPAVDQIAIHWYSNPAQTDVDKNIASFQGYVEDMSNTFKFANLGNRIWYVCSQTDQGTFITKASQWLDVQIFISGYSPFVLDDTSTEPTFGMVTNGALNQAGNAYLAAK